jgi:IS5 family transposase
MIRRRVVGVAGSLGRSTTWPNWPVATRRIVEQTRQRLAGTTPDGVTRRVSLHDPDARPIRKGRLGKPVEFGHKAQVCDNEDGIVLDHDVQPGNPPDAPRLKPAVERVTKRTSRKPRTAATAKPPSPTTCPRSASATS